MADKLEQIINSLRIFGESTARLLLVIFTVAWSLLKLFWRLMSFISPKHKQPFLAYLFCIMTHFSRVKLCKYVFGFAMADIALSRQYDLGNTLDWVIFAVHLSYLFLKKFNKASVVHFKASLMEPIWYCRLIQSLVIREIWRESVVSLPLRQLDRVLTPLYTVAVIAYAAMQLIPATCQFRGVADLVEIAFALVVLLVYVLHLLYKSFKKMYNALCTL